MAFSRQFTGPRALDSVMQALDEFVEDRERRFLTDALADPGCPFDVDALDAIVKANRGTWARERGEIRAMYERLIAGASART